MAYRFGSWKPYVPVARHRAESEREIARQARSGTGMQPVRIEGRTIARSFWGQGWYQHLESFSDYGNRLPRGRTYVRRGAVCDLKIAPGRIEARVIGSAMYRIELDIAPFPAADWAAPKRRCPGEIGSLLALLQGRLSEPVMRTVAHRDKGLFPGPGEITLRCSCPDWAGMCKHLAAVLYGIGNRLDQQPELLFRLRGVDSAELIDAGFTAPHAGAGSANDTLADERLGAIFGIELDEAPPPAATTAAASSPPAKPAKKLAKAPAAGAAPAFIATGSAAGAPAQTARIVDVRLRAGAGRQRQQRAALGVAGRRAAQAARRPAGRAEAAASQDTRPPPLSARVYA